MIKSFSDFVNENLDSSLDFAKKLAATLITKLKNDKFDSLEYSLFSKLEFTEPFEFDFNIYVKRDNSPDFTNDSHFKNLPWEEINFNEKGYAIDAHTRINRGDLAIPEITMHLLLDPKHEPASYSNLYLRLLDIIVHETNHLDQIGDSRKPFNSMPSHTHTRQNAKKSYKYFLMPDEIESMLEGMYARAKAADIPLDYAFVDYLQPFLSSKYISQSEYQKVLAKWIEKAVELYPDAKLSSFADKIINGL